MPNTKQRFSISEIKETKWFKKYSNRKNSLSQIVSPIANKKRKISSSSSSQPTKIHISEKNSSVDSISQPLKSFSQPSHIENLVISTQFTQMSQSSQSHCVNIYQKLVKRMTRFFTRLSVEDTCDQLLNILEKMNYNINKNATNVVCIKDI